MAKAVALFSGSLASILAVKLVLDEPGVEEVKLLHFRSPFFRDYEPIKELAQRLFGLSFRSQSLKKDFRELSGSGSRSGAATDSDSDVNCFLRTSCFGCRKLMLRKGLRYMKRVGADFLVTGEILGRRGLELLELEELARQVGAEGRVLRPLSAKLLPETLPEREGWVRRDRLLDLCESDGDGSHSQSQGRDGDHLQAIAQKLGLELEPDEVFPAERRCKLTQPHFSQRLEDLLREKDFTLNSLELLEFPLYYKKPPDIKIVLGCDDEEKRRLQNFFLPEDLRLYVPVNGGPMALVRTNWEEKSPEDIAEIIELAARITVSHAQVKGPTVQAKYRFENGTETYQINVAPLPPQELQKYIVS